MEVPTLYYLQLYDLINTSMKYCLFKIPHFIIHGCQKIKIFILNKAYNYHIQI